MRFDTGTLNQRSFVFGSELDSTVSYRNRKFEFLTLGPLRIGGCLELYYCNMVEWSWWDSSLIWLTNCFPSVLWHCWYGYMTCKNPPWNYL